MIFSKSFGYAIRGILYVTLKSENGKKVQLDEIADTLDVPRFFLAKVMKELVKREFLSSNKGHSGGFGTTEKTLTTSLLEIAELLGDLNEAEGCVLRFRACSNANPCPLHEKIQPIRAEWKNFLVGTRIKDLMDHNTANFLSIIVSS